MRTPAFRPRAALDLESLVVYLEMPTLGRSFLDDSLEGEAYRWHLVGQYRIFYTHSAETLTVWRILHTRQDLDGYALIDWGE